MATQSSNDPLVWIDCEMTGLDPSHDTILSISCFITSAQLVLLDSQGYDAIIRHSKEALEQMSSWCVKTHSDSGLVAACISSTTTAQEAAEGLLAYVKKYVPHPRKALLAGNSVHCDKEFLKNEPWRNVVEHLHYRILDVSSIKEAARRWAPAYVLDKLPLKKGLHTAREDILESIEEARFYKSYIFGG